MEVAHLPSHPPQQLSEAQVRILALLVDGTPHTEIAARLAKGDPRKAKAWRRRIRDWMAFDPNFQAAFATLVKAEAAVELPGVTKALIRRAKRGRVDAIKLLFELTGFYNPKSEVKHDHTGDIKITLEMGGRPEPIVDADVVK